MAAACGLLRAPVGEVLSNPMGKGVLLEALSEVIRVGRARGVNWAANDEKATVDAIASLPFGMKPSFLVDLERGGPTELDVLSGTVLRLGRKLGIATPVHERVVRELAAEMPFAGSPASPLRTLSLAC